jgi:hypothetical protein
LDFELAKFPTSAQGIVTPCALPSASEVELTPDPEQVGGTAEKAFCLVDQHRRPERSMLPVDVELDPAVGVPVDAEVDHVDVVGPQVAVGERGG